MRIPNQQRDARTIRRRLIVAAILCTAAVAALLSQMVNLQIVDHQHYVTRSQENRLKVVPVAPTRGLIYDRNGAILVENRPSFQLVATPERIPDLDAALDQIGTIIALTEEQRSRFKQRVRSSRHFEEIPLRTQLNDEEVALLAVHRHRFPGFEVSARLVRSYPHNKHAVHAIGHVGRINPRELRRIDQANYRGTHHIGKTGIEYTYEEVLHGSVGYERVETNALGRVVRTLERHPPRPGNDLFLTLDSDLQRSAERALGDRRGAIVALEPHSGEILALVSRPSYDPNLFVEGMSVERFQSLEAGDWQPLFNRAARGTYPPASTIKPFVGLAALNHDVITAESQVHCNGTYHLPGSERPFRCWREHGHGDVDYAKAIAESCNVFFYDTAFRLGIDRMASFLAPFGFGAETSTDILGERTGVLPSRDWKLRATGERWFHGETVISGIGLGYFSTTPLQLAKATAVIANRGTIVTPRLVRTIRNGEDGTLTPTAEPPVERIEVNDPEIWETTIHAMQRAVEHPRGTARLAGEGLQYTFAGKTGTAQVAGLRDDQPYEHEDRPEHLRDHALFIGFAPADAPKIAVAVVVEHAGGGGANAAPLARAVTDAWLLNDLSYLEALESQRLDTDEVAGEEGTTSRIRP